MQVQKVMKNKQCQMTEAELQVELENLQIQLEEENKVNKVSTSSHNYPISRLAYITELWNQCFK